MSLALFQRVLGADFEILADQVKALHLATGHRSYRGRIEVIRGRNPLALLFAWATHLPPAGTGEVEVEISAADGQERWTRHIGGQRMSSRLWEQEGVLWERLGPVRFAYRTTAEQGMLRWRVAGVRVLVLPLPARWFRQVVAHESERDGRYCFDVAACLPMIGLLVRYRGWLHVE